MKVFIAAPFFSLAEREFNSKIAQMLRKFNQVESIWLAQEHGMLESSHIQSKSKIFHQDLKAIQESDLIIAILDGETIDSGVAFELGYAYALGKPIIGIKTDYRWFSQLEELNLMIQVPLVKLIKSQDLIQIENQLREAIQHLCSP